MNIVGKGIAKIDGMSIATGKPVYTDDLAVKEALVVKIIIALTVMGMLV